MQVSSDTPWRGIGKVPYAIWKKRITDAGGMEDVAAYDVWLACGDDSALMLEFLHAESSYGSDFGAIPASKKNYWNLQIAGIGITFTTIREAALAWRGRIYDANYKQGIYTRTQTISDLISTYAPKSDGNDTDGYIAKVVAGMNRNGFDVPVTVPIGEEPEDIPVATYTYDNGVKPSIKDYKVSEANKFAGYINPSDHFIAGVVIHSAYGGLEGSSSWFAGGNALTDYMVGNSFDGGSLDGELRRFNDPYGPRYSWASGPVSSPIDDAAKFLEIFGPNPEVVNMYTTAIERSCAANVATNPVTDKEHASRCAMIAYHANEYGKRVKAKTGKDGFTCDTFPLIPGENNRSFLIYHGEINSGKRQTCPDPYVRATIDRIVADVRTILAKWQKNADTIPPVVPPEQMPEYAKPKPIPELQAYKDKDVAPSYVKVGKDTFIFVSDRVRATKATPRYQTANTASKERIGPDIEKGTEFAVNWLFFDEKGIAWFISPYETRVLADDTERIKDQAA